MTGEAFSHDTVLLDETVNAVLGHPSGVYVDATFGRGGHSRKLLASLGSDARLLVIDKDPQAIEVAEALAAEDDRVTVCHGSFAEIADFVARAGVARVDGVLADLGVSSPQLDDASRGFSFQKDGPLDMRMDPTSGESASVWLSHVDEQELTRVLRDYGEERFAKRIARAIVERARLSPIETTLDLAKLVSEANPAWEKNKHPATRTFQAIRIFINRELEDLERFLSEASSVLAVGGRLSVISFHSLEDRIVKRFMRDQSKGAEPPPGVPVMEKDIARNFRVTQKALKPSKDEVGQNVRARSAVMRCMERIADV